MNVGPTCRRAILTFIAGAFGITAMFVTADAGREVSHPSSSSISQITSGRADQASSAGMVHCLSQRPHDCAPMTGEQSSDTSQQSAGAPAGQQDSTSKWVDEASWNTTIHFTSWD
jgi:hypothetical protein